MPIQISAKCKISEPKSKVTSEFLLPKRTKNQTQISVRKLPTSSGRFAGRRITAKSKSESGNIAILQTAARLSRVQSVPSSLQPPKSNLLYADSSIAITTTTNTHSIPIFSKNETRRLLHHRPYKVIPGLAETLVKLGVAIRHEDVLGSRPQLAHERYDLLARHRVYDVRGSLAVVCI
jgi:hypothetical protein